VEDKKSRGGRIMMDGAKVSIINSQNKSIQNRILNLRYVFEYRKKLLLYFISKYPYRHMWAKEHN
jgi:hypothetical protein